MNQKIANKIIRAINFSLKVDANSTCTTVIFQPKVPAKLAEFKKIK
ncbi:MAG: cyclic lactone autoinducer peptide [Eubacterium sp.]|jgi:cyclic lactone autoinducer peptide|nr:cyclic lactone autoinducer peptide [Eubacterium sp.]